MPNKLRKCTVCGERAKGYNFCAISCQSCKAFFRRNAFKYEKYKCRFSNNCLVDQKTRRLCKKCRLRKCFAVGMKKEWILNAEEKESRRRQIEENRIKKFGDKRKASNGSTFSTFSPSPGVDPQETDSLLDVTQNQEISDYDETDKSWDTNIDEMSPLNHNNTNIISDIIHQIRNYSTNIDMILIQEPNYVSNIKIKDLDSNEMSDTSQSMNISETTDEKSLDLYNNENSNECEMAVKLITNHTMDKLNNSNYFNKYECKRIKELFDLSMFKKIIDNHVNLINSLDEPMYTVTINLDELMESAAQKFDASIQELVATIKKLGAFQSLTLNDQIAMVKYNCIELQILKSGLCYNSDSGGWIFKVDNDLLIKVEFEALNGFKYSFVALLKYYLNTFAKEFDSDFHILQLLVPIILFNPERPNIIHKEMIELHQQLYLYLLQKYLRMKYGSECEKKFTKISDMLQDLKTLNELHKQNFREVKPELCGPLLKEILDLPSNHIKHK